MSKIINRHGNFTLVPNGFIEADLSHETFRLYVVLLSYAKGNATDGGDVFPAYDALKGKTRIKHNKTIANALRALEELGWLERRKRFGASTIYTLTSPSPRDVMEDAPVSHLVTRSKSRRDVQYVTPSKANNTQLTKHKEQHTKEEEARAQEKLAATPPPPSPLWSDERVAAYAERFKKSPTQTNARIIQSRVAASDIELWREVLRTWAERGWSGSNIAGMCERYESAVIARQAAADKVHGGAGKSMSDAEYREMLVEQMRGAA